MTDTILQRLRKRYGRKSLLFLVLLLAAVVAGFVIDPKGFVVNSSAGILGIFIGFGIAVLFFDEYQKAKRYQQWERVRDLTYRAITEHLCMLLDQVLINYAEFLGNTYKLKTAFGQYREKPNQALLSGILDLRERLDMVPIDVQINNAKLNLEFYDDVAWDLDKVGEVLLPRVLEFSDEEEIIAALVRLDDARDRFQNAVYVERSISIGITFEDLGWLLQNIHDFFKTLIPRWR